MKNTNTTLTKYAYEVLGVSSYICPQACYNLRTIRGHLPCNILIVLFQQASAAHKTLLKKIMNSVSVWEYSILEIKDKLVLTQLFSQKTLAKHLIFFGAKDLLSCVANKHDLNYIQLFSLQELNGNTTEIKNKKQLTWARLKQWKQQLKK